MESTYLPSILLIDDDVSITNYLRNNFHDKASTGVLVSNELNHAKRLLDMEDLPIDAVVADLFFEERYLDRKNDLLDGIDLLNYTKNCRPNTDLYVFSVWSNEDYEQEKAKKLELDIKLWMNKIYHDPDQKEGTPWGIVSRDIIKRRTNMNDELCLKINALCDTEKDFNTFSDCVESLNLPVRTFLQDLNDKKYIIKKPLQILCIKDDAGVVTASTINIGLTAEGYGPTISDAIEELKEVVKDQVNILNNEPIANLENFAKLVKTRLDRHIRYKA